MPKDKKIALTITANTRQLRTDMRRAGREVKTFERQVMGLGAKMRQVKMRMQGSGIFGRGGGMLRGAAGFAGVFGFTQMIEQAKAGNAALTDIAITGNLTDKELKNLKDTMFEISNNTGKSTAELGRFVATVTTMTGDARGAQKALSGIADVMVATGASGEALAGTYVKLTTTMGLMPKQAREAFNVLRSQEKLGSVTMANISANFGKIVGAGGVFGAEGRGIKGVRTMGGLFQIAQRGFAVGQEGEAATSAASFLRFLGQRAKRVKKTFGVDVFDKEGKARDLPTVLEELGTAFNTKGKAFRTKGALIFGRSGIRTAQQLALAMKSGAASGQGSFASFNALMRTAGGTDVIGSDKARRERSAAHEFDKQLNILKNALKRHITPLFKELAAGMKKWGPDLVRTLKFLLEHSAGLLKLWLGYKGVTFFRRLAGPVQGGAAGQAAMAGIPGLGGTGGGGMAMLPNGRMVPASALATSYGRTGIVARPVAQGFGAGHVWQTDAQMLQRERRFGRTRAAGRWMGGMASRYGGRVGRYGGQAAGAAGMMGILPRFGDAAPDMGANMALMSGNPYAMAAGAGYKYTGMIGSMKSGNKWLDRANKYGSPIQAINSLVFDAIQTGEKVNLGSIVKSKLQDVFVKEQVSKAKDAIGKYYSSTGRGMVEQEGINALLGESGAQNMFAPAEFGTRFGINAGPGAAMARRLGTKGLFRMQAKLGNARARAKQIAMANLGGKAATPENLREASPQYAKLDDMWKAIDRLIVQLKKGMSVQITQPNGTSPGARVAANAGDSISGLPGGGIGIGLSTHD
jgi:hypothetical protein